MEKFRNYIIEQSFTDDEYPNIFRALKDISKDRQLIESMTPSDEILKENFNEYSLNRVERWLSKLSEDNFKILTTSKSKEKIKKAIGEKEDVGERVLDIFNSWIDGEFCAENKILSRGKEENGDQEDINEAKIPKGISDEAREAIKKYLENLPKDANEEVVEAAIDALINAIDNQ